LKILVTGAKGQLGQCLTDQDSLDNDINIDAYSSSELDITDLDALRNQLKISAPDYVINAAAYTAVDKAESEPEKAFAVNETGTLNLAVACNECDTPLIHVSTDYVFSGTASLSYKETDTVRPSSVYGASKLAGEKAIMENCSKYIIVRTAWVFSEYGNNFVKTMLKLGQSRDSLSVVGDQVGNPTYAGDLAKALIDICKVDDDKSTADSWGIYHYVGGSVVSWHQFAQNIFEKALSTGLIQNSIAVESITTAEYPTPASRPAYSVLDTQKIKETFGVKTQTVDSALTRMLNALGTEPH